MRLSPSQNRTLTEVNPTGFSVGDIAIFTELQEYTDIPWADLGIAQSLNRYYYGLHSGDKVISPLLDKLIVGDTITLSEMQIIAKVAHDMFIHRWEKLWFVRDAEYNPINNYDMVENESINDETEYGNTITRTDNLSHAKTGYDTTTPNITTDKTRDIYGFNSSDASNADAETEAVSGTNRTDYHTTDADSGTQTHAQTGTDAKEVTRELTRSGNIGVTTSQQMLESEISLWQWEFFTEVVFPDIDRVMTIKVY